MSEVLKRELVQITSKVKEIENAELITCVEVMVQVKIVKTKMKQITICFQFPKDYPREPVLVELKSKVMSTKLLDGLSKILEEEAKKLIGQYQVLPLVTFVKKFLDDNPLSVCSEEISAIKRKLFGPNDEIKLKQKFSQVVLKLKEEEYYIHARLTVPDNYPTDLTEVEISNTNLPEMLRKNFATQCVEIARRCVEPPLRRKPKDPPFESKPALYPVAEYLITNIIRKYPHIQCKLCSELCLPKDPKNVINTLGADKFVERIYCSDLFHHKCMDTYMKTPPFEGGKKCPGCGKRIYHNKWHISPEIAEARWAHKEARNRELDEVIDFLQ